MSTKITVNGVTYDSIDAMPAEARRLYEQTLARVSELGDRESDGVPDLVAGAGPIQFRATTRKTFIVNGTKYEDVNALPPDVRQAYEQAMRAAKAGDPNPTKNEIKVTFQTYGPHFQFRVGSGAPPVASPPMFTQGAGAPSPGMGMTPRPIEPSSTGAAFRVAIAVAACAAAGVALWLWTRAH
jgi:hypothetical protein